MKDFENYCRYSDSNEGDNDSAVAKENEIEEAMSEWNEKSGNHNTDDE